MSYGERISKLRQDKDITQKQLAEAIYVTDKTISSWESNRTEPSLDMIIKLSEILECSVNYLLYGDNFKDNIEMEIKVRLNKEEYDYFNEVMKEKGTFLSEGIQQDTYYILDNLDNNVKTLRIRESGNKKILTYKSQNNTTHCEEYEVEIDNSENLEKIFNLVGLNKIIEVKKERKNYSYLDKYEVSLDKVDSLGYFIEIEVKDSIRNFPEEYDNLIKTSNKLGLNLNNIERRHYPELIMDNSK